MLRQGSELEGQELKLSKPLIRRVASFARPYRARLGVLLGLVVLGSLLGVVIPPLLTESIINRAIGDQNMRLLYLLAGAYFTVILFGAIVELFARWLSSAIGEGLIFDLRVALFDHVQRMPIAFFTRTQTGALLSRLNNDVIGAQRAVTETTVGVIKILFDVAFALGLMFYLEWRLTLLSVALVPLFLLPTRRMGKILQRLIKRQMDNNAAMNTQMTERFQIGGALLVKLFGRPRHELGEFSDRAGQVRDLGVKTAVYGRLFFVTFTLVGSIGTVLVYWFGGRQVISGETGLEVGTLVAFAQALSRLYMPVTALSNVRVEVMTAMVSFQRVFELLDFPSTIVERPGAMDLVNPKGLVEYDRVNFRYPPATAVSIPSLQLDSTEHASSDGAQVLTDVSFTINPGETVALVGPSGAGKTTISLLLPRLYDVTDGVVRIDGHDVRELTLDSLSAGIGVVTQDAHLFHDTIRANLLYAKPDATEAEMIETAKAARIHNLIASLPDGYETTVGERGYRFSGGEKQRLAIARLLLKNPAIMILDEATAHLDSESEVLIQRALAEALTGRSSLVIAHRLSTVQGADQILVIESGRIVERGTHWELLDAKGPYAQLYSTQFERGAQVVGVEES